MSEHSLTLAFAGTPVIAAIVLQSLLESRPSSVQMVLTQPDRPKGRGRQLAASPVKMLAEQHEIEVFQPETKAELDQEINLARVDLLIVVAYGMILPEHVIQKPRLGAINIHTSLLPRWRGAAPIQRAIEAGDPETGVTIMQMDAGLDTGDILLSKALRITEDETSASLHSKLAELGSEALLETLDLFESAAIEATSQSEADVCYAHKIKKSEAEIDWQQDAIEIERKVRAFNPTPVCFTRLKNQDMRVWKARVIEGSVNQSAGELLAGHDKSIVVACGNNALELLEIQLPGKKPVAVKAFLNARPDFKTS